MTPPGVGRGTRASHLPLLPPEDVGRTPPWPVPRPVPLGSCGLISDPTSSSSARLLQGDLAGKGNWMGCPTCSLQPFGVCWGG